MRPEHEKYHKIDRYLRGELNEEEMTAFKEELSNPDFASEVEYQRSINELISANAYHGLRGQMTEDLNKLKGNSPTRKWIGGSVIVACLLIGSIYLLTNPSDHKSKPDISIVKSTADGKPQNKFQDKNQTAPSNKTASVSTIKEAPRNNSADKLKGEPRKAESKSLVPHELSGNQPAVNPGSVINSPTDSVQSNKIIFEKGIENKNLASENKAVKHDCNLVTIKANWRVEKACKNKNDGRIYIDKNSIEGGEGPYTVHFSKENTEIPENDFEFLRSGEYLLSIHDSKGCSATWHIGVLDKFCKNETISISVNNGEKWRYEGHTGDNYYLSIYNEAGQLIVRPALLSGNFEWPEPGNSGELQSGIYIYVIEYTNGNKETGQITIIR